MDNKLIYSIITRKKSSKGTIKRLVSLRKEEKDGVANELSIWVDETVDRYLKDIFISQTYNCYDYLLIEKKLESEEGIKLIELINNKKKSLNIKRVDCLEEQNSFPCYPFVGILNCGEKKVEIKVNSLKKYLLLKQSFFRKLEKDIQ